MENEHLPHRNRDEILTEAELAARFKVDRVTLNKWRGLTTEPPLPFVPSSDGRKPGVRYIWGDAFDWFRARSRNLPELAPEPARRPGRPRNVDRLKAHDDGRSA